MSGVRGRVGWVPWLLAAVFAALYAAVAIIRYTHFVWSSWDLAIFTQVVDSYAHLHWPVAAVKGPGFEALGDHFSPALAVLAVPYRIFPSPVTLLVCQALLLGVSVVPVGRLAIRRLGATAGIAIAIAYGLSWGFASATRVDFHEVALAVPLLAFSLTAFVEQRWDRAALWAVPLVLVKEDLGATVAVIGLLVAARSRGEARRRGLLLAGFGVLASAVIVLVVIPAVAAGHDYAYASQFGSGGLGHALLTPWHWLTPWTKVRTLVLLVGITGAACLRSPLALVAVPTLAWRFLSDNTVYWGTDWHYDAVLMPIVFVAMVDGIERLRASGHAWSRGYARVAVPAAVTVAIAMLPGSSYQTVVDRSAWSSTSYDVTMRDALAHVPRGVTVQSDLGLLSHLAGRDRTTWIGDTAGPAPAYVVTAAGAGWDPPGPRELPGTVAAWYPGHHFRVVWTHDGVSVLRRLGQLGGRH